MDELLDEAIDALRRDPVVLGLVTEALQATGGDPGAATGLVQLRLHQLRPDDAVALVALARVLHALEFAEGLARAHYSADAAGRRARDVLARAEAVRRHSHATRQHSGAARTMLREVRARFAT